MPTRAEPRSMTLVDVMALAAGVALAIPCRPILGAFPYAVPEPWVMLVIMLAWAFWVGAAALSAVVAARSVRYRRRPRAAEWLAILMTLTGLMAMGPMRPIDTLARWLPFGMVGGLDTLSDWRWTSASLAPMAIGAGLGLLRLGRDALPAWAKSAGLVLLAYLALAGPVSTVGMYGADLLAPPGGFGPGLLSELHWLACQLAATTPMALMLGLPAVAALAERVGRVRWRWTEWGSVLASALIALTLSPLYRGNFRFPAVGWAAERVLVGAWLVGVGMLSRAILGRLGPAWSRWLGDQAVGSGATPIATSPERTCST